MKMVKDWERERKREINAIFFLSLLFVLAWKMKEKVRESRSSCYTLGKKLLLSVNRFNAIQFEVSPVPSFLPISICCLFSGIAKQIHRPYAIHHTGNKKKEKTIQCWICYHGEKLIFAFFLSSFLTFSILLSRNAAEYRFLMQKMSMNVPHSLFCKYFVFRQKR